MVVDDDSRTVAATERSLDIVSALQRLNGARVTELARDLDISKSTAYSHLATLQKCGFVVREGDEYHLGLRFSNLGEYARNRKRSYIWARELAEYLEEKTGLESGFVVEENGFGMYLKSETGEMTDPNLFPQVGGRLHLHASAAGKAILAALPESRVTEILDSRGMPAQTEKTITSREVLFDELERIRERGYATNTGENTDGIRAVGVAVRDTDGTVLGAASLSGPRYRMSGQWFEEELPEQMLSLIDRFESP